MSGAVVELLGPSAGGIRAHVSALSRHLRERGWAVTTAGPAGVMDGVGDQDAIVQVPAGWNPIALVRARGQLLSVLTASPDLVHAHGLKAALVVLTIRRHPPLVLTIHNLVTGTHAGPVARILRRIEAAIIVRVDYVIVISDEIEVRLRDLTPSSRRSFVLPVSPTRTVGRSRAEVRNEFGIDPDAPLVVVVARLHPQKDLGMFLRALAEVERLVPSTRAIIVGDGPEHDHLVTQSHGLGLQRVVTFAGHRANPVDEMNAADVVALSSRWEGSPLVIAEYLAVGKPLVTTAVGTVTRHLTDRVDARLVPVGDHRALAEAIAELLHDPALAASIGAAGHRIGQTVFDVDTLVDGVEAAYAMVTS